jgi:AcrR family transcriptional regulator
MQILDVAWLMLRERPLSEISLNDMSHRIGLSKSNVLRYFDSREAIFLEILDQRWTDWLNELDPALTELEPAEGTWGREIAVATFIAESMVDRPTLCELITAMARVLERDITVEFARTFKRRASENTSRLAELVRAAVPELTAEDAEHFARGGLRGYVRAVAVRPAD